MASAALRCAHWRGSTGLLLSHHTQATGQPWQKSNNPMLPHARSPVTPATTSGALSHTFCHRTLQLCPSATSRTSEHPTTSLPADYTASASEGGPTWFDKKRRLLPADRELFIPQSRRRALSLRPNAPITPFPNQHALRLPRIDTSSEPYSTYRFPPPPILNPRYPIPNRTYHITSHQPPSMR